MSMVQACALHEPHTALQFAPNMAHACVCVHATYMVGAVLRCKPGMCQEWLRGVHVDWMVPSLLHGCA